MIPASEYLVKVSLCVVKPSEQLIAFNFFFYFQGPRDYSIQLCVKWCRLFQITSLLEEPISKREPEQSIHQKCGVFWSDTVSHIFMNKLF